MDRDSALLRQRVDEFISELESLAKQDSPEALSEYLGDCWDEGEHLAELATYAIEQRSHNPWSHAA